MYDDDAEINIAGLPLVCQHCSRDRFVRRGAPVQDASEHVVYVCAHCGYLHWFHAPAGADLAALHAVPGVTQVERDGEQVVVYGQGDRLVSGVVNAMEGSGTPLRDLRTEQPTLEDVFIQLTGRRLRE